MHERYIDFLSQPFSSMGLIRGVPRCYGILFQRVDDNHGRLASSIAPGPVDADEDKPARGVLVSAPALGAFDVDEVATLLREFGIDDDHVRLDVEAHRIVYDTIDPKGQPQTASALVVLPTATEDVRDLVC